MVRQLLWRYLVDRSGLILAYVINTALVLFVIHTILSYRVAWLMGMIMPELGYAAAVSLVMLLLYLAVDLARWWPFAYQAESLLRERAPLEALAALPPAGNVDQALTARLAARLESLWSAERLRLQQQYERHIAFTNLWVHQMKTPVAAISVLAQESGQQPQEELRATIAAIEEEALGVADGLELVLNLARLQDFAHDYLIRRVDLAATVRDVINHRKKQFIRSAIFPEVTAAGSADWTVLTDEKWNRFVIDQLVANALKYSAQVGRESQRLRFQLQRTEEAVVLSLIDQGPGIPEEDLPRIYEPFFTGENGRRFGGATGIGLYLVRQIADRLGHQLEITSRVGEGTVATLSYRLPTLQN